MAYAAACTCGARFEASGPDELLALVTSHGFQQGAHEINDIHID